MPAQRLPWLLGGTGAAAAAGQRGGRAMHVGRLERGGNVGGMSVGDPTTITHHKRISHALLRSAVFGGVYALHTYESTSTTLCVRLFEVQCVG